MSSRDRNRGPRQSEPSGSYYSDDIVYDDDVLYDEDWNETGEFQDEPEAAPARPSATARQSSASRGTASQLDRLRRNIGRAGNSGTQRQQPSATSRPEVSQPSQPAQRPARQSTRPVPRYDIEDDTYLDDSIEEAPIPTRSTVRSQSAGYRSARPAPAPATETPLYYDDEYDDQGYDVYEDEYSDDFSEYDAPVRPSRASRPRPQISMPSMSRPSLPPAIANADLVNDAPALGIIGVGLASLAGMAILVANQVDGLAPSFATHVSASGILEDFRGETALWNLPVMATAFTLMNIVIAWFISPMDRFASRFVLAAALVVQIIVWVAIIRSV